MINLSPEQIAFAVASLDKLVKRRDLTQTQLANQSGVAQSQISKILKDQAEPSSETLRKLFQALGLKLEHILHEAHSTTTDEIVGYLATPLTAVVASPQVNGELERMVSEIRRVASSAEFADPSIDLYWPGDHTHPVRHSEFRPDQVYLTDRSRASTFDFIVLFCACPSFGVGQENEIATQACLPAIRLVPESGISRMMSGSFLHAVDVKYRGSLDSGVEFEEAELVDAFRQLRKTYFRQRAFFSGMNGNDFGPRLRKLVDDRSGDYQALADDLGISLRNLLALMDEPFAVSNPSACLLRRLSVRLRVSVGHLLGESQETDPVLTESLASWRSWIDTTPGLDAATAVKIKDDWQEQHAKIRMQLSAASFRNSGGAMRAEDWKRLYQEARSSSAKQTKMFQD